MRFTDYINYRDSATQIMEAAPLSAMPQGGLKWAGKGIANAFRYLGGESTGQLRKQEEHVFNHLNDAFGFKAGELSGFITGNNNYGKMPPVTEALYVVVQSALHHLGAGIDYKGTRAVVTRRHMEVLYQAALQGKKRDQYLKKQADTSDSSGEIRRVNPSDNASSSTMTHVDRSGNEILPVNEDWIFYDFCWDFGYAIESMGMTIKMDTRLRDEIITNIEEREQDRKHERESRRQGMNLAADQIKNQDNNLATLLKYLLRTAGRTEIENKLKADCTAAGATYPRAEDSEILRKLDSLAAAL